MEKVGGIKAFYARTRKPWRKWLEINHDKEKSVWLIIHHKASKTPSVYYDEAVEEALCFGWIDSKGNKRNDESFYLYFAKRKPKSNWSRINRLRAKKMIQAELMTPSGQVMIDLAKRTGTWTALNRIEGSKLPEDLQRRFNKNKTALKNFNAFPPSSKRIILGWILNAKKKETREQRVNQTVLLAAKNIRVK